MNTTTSKVTLSNDGKMIHIFIPMKLHRRGGRKVILSPQGRAINPDRNEEQDAALLTALVRGHRWNRMLKLGKVANVRELAAQENIVGERYVSQLLRLTTLAPDIQEAILNWEHPPLLTLADLMKPFPIEWGEQRRVFGFD